MLKKELSIFLTAVMFYTRLPVPKSTVHSGESLNLATRYFPLIGIIVGGTGALCFLAANFLISPRVAVLFSMSMMILMTGAFHEDALSDFCDGFGGGYTVEKILLIMKDSRIGTYGAAALVMLLISKYALLTEIKVCQLPLVMIAAHAMSRLNPVLMIFSSQYVREDASSKSKPIGEKTVKSTLVIGLIIGLLPLLLMPLYTIPFLILGLGLIFLYFRHYVHKVLGGYTGDVLGALQQLSELGFYVIFLGAEKFYGG